MIPAAVVFDKVKSKNLSAIGYRTGFVASRPTGTHAFDETNKANYMHLLESLPLLMATMLSTNIVHRDGLCAGRV